MPSKRVNNLSPPPCATGLLQLLLVSPCKISSPAAGGSETVVVGAWRHTAGCGRGLCFVLLGPRLLLISKSTQASRKCCSCAMAFVPPKASGLTLHLRLVCCGISMHPHHQWNSRCGSKLEKSGVAFCRTLSSGTISEPGARFEAGLRAHPDTT